MVGFDFTLDGIIYALLDYRVKASRALVMVIFRSKISAVQNCYAQLVLRWKG